MEEPISLNDAICQHCGRDLEFHHYRNLKCPTGETIEAEAEAMRREIEAARQARITLLLYLGKIAQNTAHSDVWRALFAEMYGREKDKDK